MEEWKISEIIPQRNPIIMVDKLCSASPEGASTMLSISPDNMFCNSGHLSEAGIIEHMAQSSSAMVGYNWKKEGKAIPVGFIGEVKKFTLCFLPKIGETIHTDIKVISEAMGITLVSAKTHVNDTLAASCQMKIFIRE